MGKYVILFVYLKILTWTDMSSSIDPVAPGSNPEHTMYAL